jgi:hypothetical protein
MALTFAQFECFGIGEAGETEVMRAHPLLYCPPLSSPNAHCDKVVCHWGKSGVYHFVVH